MEESGSCVTLAISIPATCSPRREISIASDRVGGASWDAFAGLRVSAKPVALTAAMTATLITSWRMVFVRPSIGIPISLSIRRPPASGAFKLRDCLAVAAKRGVVIVAHRSQRGLSVQEVKYRVAAESVALFDPGEQNLGLRHDL